MDTEVLAYTDTLFCFVDGGITRRRTEYIIIEDLLVKVVIEDDVVGRVTGAHHKYKRE